MPLDPYARARAAAARSSSGAAPRTSRPSRRRSSRSEQGQHEAALQTIKGLLTAHAANPSVWLYYAQFLYKAAPRTWKRPPAVRPRRSRTTRPPDTQKFEQAEEALSKALELNPNFGMAYFLRGQFRENEGELIGALLLYRKAAEAYDPEAHDQLAAVYIKIYQGESMLNRPVAARAALERAVHFQPADPELRAQLEGEFGPEGPLPGRGAQEVHVPPDRQARARIRRDRQALRRPQGVRATHAS